MPAPRLLVAYSVPAAIVLVALFFWQRGAYINYAEGVYLFSSRLVLEGATPYRDFIAAHPPLLFYAGAGILAIWDSIDGVRIVLALLTAITGGLVVAVVHRLTRSAPAAVLAGLISLLTPWSLREHTVLTPETFGEPLLMGAILLAARPRTAAWAGVVAAVAVGFKWPFLLFGLALTVVTPARGRFLVTLAAGFAAGVLLSFALFGAGPLYDQLVVAQQDVGWHPIRAVAAYTVQAGWNLLPLLVPAVLGVLGGRSGAADQALFRTLLAGTAAAVALIATYTKTGTYLNVIALAEPPLVALAAAGVVWSLRGARPRLAIAAIAATTAFGLAQVASFIAAPHDPGFFVRPFSAPAHGWVGEEEVSERLALARGCPRRVAYSGQPYYAFLLGQRMPGDEPDQFLMFVAGSRVGEPFAAEAEREQRRCP